MNKLLAISLSLLLILTLTLAVASIVPWFSFWILALILYAYTRLAPTQVRK